MSLDLWKAVDEYFNDLLVPGDPDLEAALSASAQAGIPPGNVAPNQGKLLMILAQSMRACAILELGTLGGYSAIWLAHGLEAGGRLITLEADPHYAAVARTNFVRAGLADVIDLRLGPALETLPQLAAEGAGPFDLIFLDADKANNAAYFDWALKLSRCGTLIVADNVARGGAVIAVGSEDLSVQGVRLFLERLGNEPRVIATALQTVGSKGHDGFAIALVVSV